jgi:DNA-binding CsgD family transcriptional regulator
MKNYMRQEKIVAATPELVQAIREIQLASANRERWPTALDAIVQFLDARSAALIFEDGDTALLELKYSTRAEKAWIVDYLSRHRRLDLDAARQLKSVEIGAVFTASNFVSSAQFKDSDLYRDWLAPHGLAEVAGAVVHRSENGACLFVALFDKEGDARTRSRLEALTPYLSAAISNGARAADDDGSMIELFNQLAAPIIVVGADMRIRFANPAAQEELRNRSAFDGVGGALVVSDPHAQETLKLIVSARVPSPQAGAIIAREGPNRCCVIHTLPLSGGATALISRTLDPGPSEDIAVAARVYGLTAREQSVLLAIAQVGGVPATARALKLSEGTVRSYLKSIFQKTGARRQAELVRLALVLRSPFRPDWLQSESKDRAERDLAHRQI